MTIDLNAANERLTTTRAVRRRMRYDKPVDLSIIEECVDIALQAPSVSDAKKHAGPHDMYPHFVVVDDEKLKAGIGAVYFKTRRL